MPMSVLALHNALDRSLLLPTEVENVVGQRYEKRVVPPLSPNNIRSLRRWGGPFVVIPGPPSSMALGELVKLFRNRGDLSLSLSLSLSSSILSERVSPDWIVLLLRSASGYNQYPLLTKRRVRLVMVEQGTCLSVREPDVVWAMLIWYLARGKWPFQEKDVFE